jgi:hypothetical protein
MNLIDARGRLDDTTFLIGGLRRRGALKILAQSADPAAAQLLAEAVDAGSPSASSAGAVLAANRDPAWTDRLWEVWSAKRQGWLGELLEHRGVPHRQASENIGVLSRLKLGSGDLPFDAAAQAIVGRYWRDPDPQVQAGARGYAQALRVRDRNAWVGFLLRLGDFDALGQDRPAIEAVVPFCAAADPSVAAAANRFCDEWLPLDRRILAAFLRQQADALPLTRDVALAAAAWTTDRDPTVLSQAQTYANRVFAAEPDFLVRFALAAGQTARLPGKRNTALEALRLATDSDGAVAEGARAWLGQLPNDQRINDLLVDEWLRTDQTFLFDLLRGQRRLPSDGGLETLLLLLWGDVDGYRRLGDADGQLLAQACAAKPELRARFTQTLQDSGDAALLDQNLRASLRVQGMDTGLALRALLAAGDEDRIVDRARDMKGSELLELCARWAGNGRRPKDPKKRAAVDRAVRALEGRPRVEIEPTEPLPEGLSDLIELWGSDSRPDEEARRDLEAADPLARARGLFAGVGRGWIGAADLKAKASSQDWPERLVAALHGAHPDAGKDHVHWVAACAGVDFGTQTMPVACGPEEFDRAATQLAEWRKRDTALYRRAAAELEALQAFRALEQTAITVTADDSATDKGAAEEHGPVSPTDLAKLFGKKK